MTIVTRMKTPDRHIHVCGRPPIDKYRRESCMITVPYKTAVGCSWVPLESFLLSKRKVFLRGEITADMVDFLYNS